MICLRYILFIPFIYLLNVQDLNAQNKEYILKASFIGKFAQFTEWPDDNLRDTFRIYIFGESPFMGELGKMYVNHKIKNKPVKIYHINKIKQIDNKCNVLFISSIESSSLNDILIHIQEMPILSISETEGYASKGVHINFYNTQKGTVHFEVNQSSLKKSKLTMDIYLLNYAKTIN